MNWTETRFKQRLLILTVFLLTSFLTPAAALPFNILPNGSLPTSVPLGGTVLASYIVTNNTTLQRNNNFVQSLPPNTSIVHSGCALDFNLAPSGQAGDSCTLDLLITGPIDAQDPNPGHHLFICFPGSLVCGGTAFPLNVTQGGPALASIAISPESASAPAGLTQQFTAIGTFTDGSTQNLTPTVSWHSASPSIATINNAGLATGVSIGASNITASSGTVTSNTAVLTIAAPDLVSIAVTPTTASIVAGGTQQYAALGTYTDNSTQDLTATASWHSSSPAVATLNGAGLATGISLGSTLISASLNAVTSNSANLLITRFSYVANATNNIISYCTTNTDGSFGTCNLTGTLMNSPTGLALNASRNLAYIVNNGNASLTYCSINAAGAFSNCTATSGGGVFSSPAGISLNPTGTGAYVTDSGNNSVFYCPISGVDGSLSTCTDTTAAGLTSPSGIVIDASNTHAFITNRGANTVFICTIGPDGVLSSCGDSTGTGFNSPTGISLNAANTFAYISNRGNSTVSVCPVTGAPSFGSCFLTGSNFDQPDGIAINSATTFAYVTNNNSVTPTNTVFFCPLNPDGSFGSCAATGSGFGGPAGLSIP